MDLRSLRRRIRRLERAIKPKPARPGTCVGFIFQLYEGDPGVAITWDGSGAEGGSNEPEPEANNVEPAEVADVDVDDIAPEMPPEEIA